MNRAAQDRMNEAPSSGGDLAASLRRVAMISRCLAARHERGEMHYALCPANVAEHDDGGIELRHAQVLPLSHTSPEQTGRMNRIVDYRSDYYSLGVMFYEMLAGRPPFVAEDRLELVHAHIARQPLDPCQVVEQIPRAVGAITLKLLAKNAEDRYQSIAGLLADLERCAVALRETGDVPTFVLGEADHCDRLHISHKLYGREAEIGKMLDVFELVAQGSSQMLLVTGYSGIGKSSLVNEIHKPIVAKRGYFVEGKFDQFNRNVPYLALSQAFRDLVRQLLTESDAQIAAWKTRILEALGPNGKILTDILPELTHLIGLQPEVASLDAVEAHNRLNNVVQKFVRVFARREHPLVVFLDDLQWADSASLKLLSLIMTAADKPSLLVIGAYRDNEVAPGSSLLATIEEIGKQSPIANIEVRALTEADVVNLIADTVKAPREAVLPLAQLIYRKTLGNPFFIGQLLASLHHEKLLTLQERKWCWDIAQIEARQITDNVVELLTGELNRLSAPTQHLLTLAACIGNRLSAAALATIAKREIAEVQALLKPAVVAGLLLDDNSGLAVGAGGSSKYRFLHDRVQQAAYASMDDVTAKRTHLDIARLLYAEFRDNSGKIFDVANQYSKALDLISDTQERLTVARLYLSAARRAKLTSAFELALQYTGDGEVLLGEEDWNHVFELCLELSLERMEAFLLNQRFAEVEGYMEKLLRRNLNDVQKVCVYELQVRSLIRQHLLVEATELGLQVLGMFGAGINPRLGKFGILLGIVRMKLLLAGRKPADLLKLPLSTDPLKAALTRISIPLSGPIYMALPQLFPAFVLKQAYLIVRDGYTPNSLSYLNGYGILLATGLGDLERGYAFGRVALELQRRGGVELAYLPFTFYTLLAHWKDHLATSCQHLLETYRLGMEKGEFETAGYCVSGALRNLSLAGEYLPSLLPRVQDGLDVMTMIQYGPMYHAVVDTYNYVARLLGVDLYRKKEAEKIFVDNKNTPSLLFQHDHYETLYHYLFNDPQAALDAAQRAEKYEDAARGMPIIATLNFFMSLSLLARYSGMNWTEAKQALIKCRSLQKKMKRWAAHAPMNYLHKWQLVEAEHYRVLGEMAKAAEHYDLAIAGAKEHQYVNEEAMANEIAGAFYLGLGKETVARAYFEEAHAKYGQWGAFAKVKQLEARYPELLSRMVEQSSVADIPVEQNQHTATQGIDLNTVIKAAQTLSGEMQFSHLLEKLMRLLIENAGADRGVLLLEREGELRVQASVEQDEIQVLQDRLLGDADMLSHGLVNYVRRTSELLVLNNACDDHRFGKDAYLARVRPKSVLCMPLLKQNQLVGVLYLENRLATDVFSTERCELLQMISAQIAISLENAQLYGELERKVELRTQDLSRANEELKLTLETLKHAQKQLVESEKMASLGGLVAGIAHEINTPVGIGVTAASHLEDETKHLVLLYRQGQMKKADLEQYLSVSEQSSRMILNNLERAAELIQSFKQVAVDQSSETRRRFNVKIYLEEILTSLSPELKKTQVTCEVDCADNIEIEGFPGVFSQIVTNLVMNALKHAYDDNSRGVISIGARQVGDQLEIELADDGKGILAEDLGKIFDPFFTTKRNSGGSGLGLHIVYNLVTQTLNGTIKCRSQPGHGTTFDIRWPVYG